MSIQERTPSPRKPEAHVQLKEPSRLEQSALAWQSWGDVVATASVSVHSSTSEQKKPLPQMPDVVHAHEYDPGVFVHVARGSQVCVPKVHSSTSLHVTPSPAKPGGQVHSNDPARSVHRVES